MRFVSAALLVVLTQVCWGQSVPPLPADANPKLEAATIKPSTPEEQRVVYVQGRELLTRATSLVDLMMFAYLAHPAQIVDGPEWMKTEKFDLVIEPDLPGRPSTAQFRVILQQMLADRFKLMFHHAERELAVYRMVPAKGGPKMTAATQEDRATNTAGVGYKDGSLMVANATMSEFASLMQRYVGMDRPIVDHTGIVGKYDFKLNWTPDISQGDGRTAAPSREGQSDAPSLYTAMQEQLGLKFEAAKEPADVMVIDRVEQPSEN